jgi:hypothetical protein
VEVLKPHNDRRADSTSHVNNDGTTPTTAGCGMIGIDDVPCAPTGSQSWSHGWAVITPDRPTAWCRTQAGNR